MSHWFAHTRTNELHPELLSTTAINPWPGQISSPRLQMLNSHISQALPVADATDRRCMTGVEPEFAKATFSVFAPKDCKVLKVIDRWPQKMGGSRVKENPLSIAVIEYDKYLSDGRIIKEVDYLEMPSHHSMHQDFGFRYNYINRPHQAMEEGEVLAHSPTVSPLGNYRFGLETNVAMMSVPHIVEDGVVASESFCERTKTTGVRSYTISFGKKEFPLNLYGDDQHYKIFPDIGEEVQESGLLMALRRYEDSFSPATMTRSKLKEVDFKYDHRVFTKQGARVVDVKVYHDARVRPHVMRNKNPQLPKGMEEQPEEYWLQDYQYYKQIFDLYMHLFKTNKDALHITPAFHRLIVEAQGALAVEPNDKIIRNYRSTPIDEWHVEITVEFEIKPTVGFKVTGVHGDKGVICFVWPDEAMPVDADGNRAELIADGLSTIKRMNISRWMEQYINAASREVAKKLREMMNNGVPREEIDRYLLGYYEIVSPSMVEMVSEEGRVVDEHLQSVLEEGIYLYVPTNNEPESMDIIRNLNNHYPPTFGPVTYRGSDGRMVTTHKSILIGSMYLMLLEKTGHNWAGVASSKLNHFGIPAKLTARDKDSAPGRNTPIRFGESETRLFTAMVGGKPTAELLDRSNNPGIRKMVFENILRAKQPTNIDSVINRKKNPAGFGRIISLARHVHECSGITFYCNGEET